MASREEEEFELVLGNKQLLSLFFLVVVLFGVFFSFGYTVGYGRGEASVTREVGSVEPVEEPAKEVQLPETLLESAPKPVEPATPATAQASPPPPPSRTTPAKADPKPSPVEKATASAPPPPTRSTTPQATAPAKPATPPATAPAKSAPPVAAGSGDYQLQVLAVRVRPDAEVFLQQLKAKGHPATLSDRGDGWYRVMVGPFNSESEAKAYQPRLEKEGLESLIRKR